jgi:hypothetical protein
MGFEELTEWVACREPQGRAIGKIKWENQADKP